MIFLNYDIYLYGAGIIGTDLAKMLERYNLCKGFIDNDPLKQGNIIAGLPVISYGEYLDKHRDAMLVITMSQKNTDSVLKSLLEDGLVLGKNCVLRDKFIQDVLPILLWHKHKK